MICSVRREVDFLHFATELPRFAQLFTGLNVPTQHAIRTAGYQVLAVRTDCERLKRERRATLACLAAEPCGHPKREPSRRRQLSQHSAPLRL